MKTLQEILTSQAFSPYLDKVNELKTLNAIWTTTMVDWARYSRIANFENGLLVLLVENAAWSTRIHYAIPDILKKLLVYPEFKHLKKIQCILSL